MGSSLVLGGGGWESGGGEVVESAYTLVYQLSENRCSY